MLQVSLIVELNLLKFQIWKQKFAPSLCLKKYSSLFQWKNYVTLKTKHIIGSLRYHFLFPFFSSKISLYIPIRYSPHRTYVIRVFIYFYFYLLCLTFELLHSTGPKSSESLYLLHCFNAILFSRFFSRRAQSFYFNNIYHTGTLRPVKRKIHRHESSTIY